MSQTDIQSQSKPIFIVGAPRSGTTLCARILGRHKHLFAPGETHYMEDIFCRPEFSNLSNPKTREQLGLRLLSIYGKYNEPDDQARIDGIFKSPDVREKLLRSATSHQNVFGMFMAAQSQSVGKSRWINNAPKDLFYVRELIAMFPDAKFLFCVRDPRDFLLSYKMKWRATADSEVKRIKSLYHPVATTLLWKACALRVLASRSQLRDDQVHQVTYEALVTHPEKSVRDICDFIGEPYEESLLNVSFTNSSFGSGGSGIHTDSIGRGRESLSQNELWWVESLLSRELRELGYTALVPRPRSLKIVADALTFPITTAKALVANRHNTGPLFPYLIRRLQSFFRPPQDL